MNGEIELPTTWLAPAQVSWVRFALLVLGAIVVAVAVGVIVLIFFWGRGSSGSRGFDGKPGGREGRRGRG